MFASQALEPSFQLCLPLFVLKKLQIITDTAKIIALFDNTESFGPKDLKIFTWFIFILFEFLYSWSDNTPLDYTNWNPGEPNDANGEEQCAEIENFDGRYKKGSKQTSHFNCLEFDVIIWKIGTQESLIFCIRIKS